MKQNLSTHRVDFSLFFQIREVRRRVERVVSEVRKATSSPAVNL